MKDESISTKYASAHRLNQQEILSELQHIESLDYINEVVNAMPFIVTILNEQRQIVFANYALMDKMGIDDIELIIGQRPGETLGCINAAKEIGGCGTSENCKYCGAVNSILNSQKGKTRVVDECRISSRVNGNHVSYDFQVTATPFTWLNRKYTMFTLQDISAEKRRRILERVFFHDILNKTGSLSGFLEMINGSEDFNRVKEITNIMEEITHELNEEIIGQRELIAAENNELVPRMIDFNTQDIVESVVQQMRHHLIATNKIVEKDGNILSMTIRTDIILLKRILINMIKNGLEASPFQSVIKVGCDKVNSHYRFWVQNPTYMPSEIQLQMFQRSFSTKGSNRGLGTYSMKLLGEKYLKGQVNFESDEKRGTTFFIDLPEYPE